MLVKDYIKCSFATDGNFLADWNASIGLRKHLINVLMDLDREESEEEGKEKTDSIKTLTGS